MSILKVFDFINIIVKVNLSFFYGSDGRHSDYLTYRIRIRFVEYVIEEVIARCLIKDFQDQTYFADIIGIVYVNQSFHVPQKYPYSKLGKTRVKFRKQFNVMVDLVASAKLIQPPRHVFSIFLLHVFLSRNFNFPMLTLLRKDKILI